MKVSENWLRNWVNPDVSQKDLLHRLTMAGLEVEGVESVASDFTGVVVGEIVACEQHPNADKLRITKVSTGSETLQVVCGAPNASVGLKSPLAKIGAQLSDGFKIKKTRLRGIESFGMLCSADELGIESQDKDGLMELSVDAPVGEDLRRHLELDDCKIEISLTPDRADCLGVEGLAREVSANFDEKIKAPSMKAILPSIDATLMISVKAQECCPRFVGRIIKNVDVAVKTPEWIVQRLQRSDISSIDPVVDVTNYVMLELGQPMHGYDLEQIDSCICVRHAKTDEKIILLDDSEQILTKDTLIIADQSKVLGIAGVMGGKHSKINDSTRHIFLESAFFTPKKLAGKARSYGLHTDASHRFERGVDFALQRKAIERASELILEVCGGEAGSVTEVVSESHLPVRHQVSLYGDHIQSLLGVSVKGTQVQSILGNLGFKYHKVGDNSWKVTVPSWRFDIAIEEDLIEEIGRIYGYDKLPESQISSLTGEIKIPEAKTKLSVLKRLLVSRGYHEAISFSLVDPQWQQAFNPGVLPVLLNNPISTEMSVMRTSLIPGLVKAVGYNQKRQSTRIKLFEEGQCFIQKEKTLEQNHWLAAVVFGTQLPESWSSNNRPFDFYDLKGDLQALFCASGEEETFSFIQGEQDGFHLGQTAIVLKKGESIGYIGSVHPALLKQFNVKGPIFGFEIQRNHLQAGKITGFEPLSKYPEVRRDMAIIVNTKITCSEVTDIIRAHAGEWLKDISIFDVYNGDGVPEGYKSIALGLTWRHQSRTLKDEEINLLFEKLILVLEEGLGAQLRK